MHVVRLALDGVREHEVCSRDGFGCPWGDDGGGQHLVDWRLLDSEQYVCGFKGFVDLRTGFNIVGDAKRSPFAVLNEYIHAGGLYEMVDGIRG